MILYGFWKKTLFKKPFVSFLFPTPFVSDATKFTCLIFWIFPLCDISDTSNSSASETSEPGENSEHIETTYY